MWRVTVGRTRGPPLRGVRTRDGGRGWRAEGVAPHIYERRGTVDGGGAPRASRPTVIRGGARVRCMEGDRDGRPYGCGAFCILHSALNQDALQVFAGEAVFALCDFFRRAFERHLATGVAAFGSQVDDMVCGLYHIEVVLDDDDRIARVG